MALWLCIYIFTNHNYHENTQSPKIRNCLRKAAIMIEAYFGEDFECERYFCEIITSIIAYEKITTHQIFSNTPVSMSALNEPISPCLFLTE